MHNQSTLAALGHTTESIKLPPEKRDRKRKTGEKVGGVGNRSGDDCGEGSKDGHKDAQEERSGGGSQGQGSENVGQTGEIGASSVRVRRVTGGSVASAVCPSTTVPESISGAAPTPAAAKARRGTNRKGKARAETGETIPGE
jgi:hypothetical protein